MFSQSADLYDAVYSFKDYAAESERLRDLVRLHGGPVSGRLLDVGCGTGAHLQHLRGHYEVEGLDVSTAERLRAAVQRLAHHLDPGGIAVIEPWFAPDTFPIGRLGAVFVDRPDLKVARMNVSFVEGGRSVLDFHYLVARAECVSAFRERHELGLFTDAEYRGAPQSAGLQAEHDRTGLDGRGLYLALKPLS